MDNKLYLSITHYDDPKQTIIRKIHTSFLGASSPISLTCKIKENKYRKYKPTLLEVFTLDLENNIIIPLSKDDMTPPTESQMDNIKGICEVLEKAYNKPETKVYASSWIAYHMTKYNEKINDILDKYLSVTSSCYDVVYKTAISSEAEFMWDIITEKDNNHYVMYATGMYGNLNAPKILKEI